MSLASLSMVAVLLADPGFPAPAHDTPWASSTSAVVWVTPYADVTWHPGSSSVVWVPPTATFELPAQSGGDEEFVPNPNTNDFHWNIAPSPGPARNPL